MGCREAVDECCAWCGTLDECCVGCEALDKCCLGCGRMKVEVTCEPDKPCVGYKHTINVTWELDTFCVCVQ